MKSLLLAVVASLTFAIHSPLSAAEGDYPLDLKLAANMDFTDDAAGNGKGGWSDQGPQNDMHGFDVARTDYGGIRFAVIDPASNNDRCVLTFDSANARTGLTTATIIVPAKAPAQPFLYLLHTSCWNQEPKGTKIGALEVTFTDGQKTTFDIQTGRDIADWWGAGPMTNGLVVLRKANASSHVGVFLSKFALPQPARQISSVVFKSEGKVVWIVLGATLSSRDLDMKIKTTLFTANDTWKPVDMSDVRVKAGSALDCSAYIEPGPAGKHGRAIATRDGHIVFANAPEKPVRFFGYDMVTTHTLNSLTGKTPEETKANIREFVTLVKRQGYNILRSLCTDTYLMVGSTKDLEFHPERLDAFEYLIATMKQEGVYLYLDLGGYGQFYKGSWDEKVVKRNMKAELFARNAGVRENWKAGVTALLTRINPYTKTALRDDPAVVCVNYYNEQELGFNKLNTPALTPVYSELWHEWLKKRYASVAAIATAWNKPDIAALKSIDDIPLPESAYGVDAVGNDYGHFLYSLEAETVDWYARIASELGYKGLASQYDCSLIYREGDARSVLPAVSMHCYHAHPSNMDHPGSQVAQNSSVGAHGSYLRGLTSTRQWDKPFLVTEHTQCFWNQYQREDGLLYAAYSALQDFQALMVHENSVWLRVTEPMGNFSIGRSPVGRANEFLSHQLYQRGDVAASPNRVELRVEQDYLKNNINRPANSFQTRLALLSGFGVRFPRPGQPAPSRESNLLLAPAEGSSMSVGDWAVNVSESKTSSAFSLAKAVEVLRQRGLLPEGNRTDVEKDLFQSDTGEITLTGKENRLAVITPRTEGVTLEGNQSATLSALTVHATSVGAAVAVSSLDSKPLRESQRLMLVYITDTANTGMELSEDRVTLIKLGTYPPLMQTGKLRVTLNNAVSPALEVWALGFDGSRREKLPVQARGKTLEITLDTAQLKNGPTPFFEIVAGKELGQAVP